MPKPRILDSTLIVFSDFDGTITQADVTDRILEELADPSWREVEDLWVRGLMGSRQCLERQMALVNASRRQLNSLVDSIPLDPGFQAFCSLAAESGIPFYVVSDGFDYVIRRVLKRAGIGGQLRNGRHLFSSSLSLREGRLRASFSHPATGCEHGCATCKPAAIRQVKKAGQTVVFIGDGLSDRFAVAEADIVFAKQRLLEYCRQQGLACRRFKTFADIQAELCNRIIRTEPEMPGAAPKAGKARTLASVGEMG